MTATHLPVRHQALVFTRTYGVVISPAASEEKFRLASELPTGRAHHRIAPGGRKLVRIISIDEDPCLEIVEQRRLDGNWQLAGGAYEPQEC